MGRLVLTVFALLFITCVVADYGLFESANESNVSGCNGEDSSEEDNFLQSLFTSANEVVPGKQNVTLPSGRTACIKKYADKMKKSSKWRSKTILLALDPSDDEYKLMENEMQSTILVQSNSSLHFSKYNISKIEKVINGRLMNRYKRRQASINSESGFINERMFFFESSEADEVVASGFNERHANINGTFGAGLYFTAYSSASNQFAVPLTDSSCMTCERKMIISRVTLGKTYKANEATRLSHPPVGYYSLQGEASQGGMKYDEYVIYRAEQAYPDYLITYTLIP